MTSAGIITHNAFEVLKSRYLQKDANGNLTEEPQQLFRRVASHIAKAEGLFNNRTKREETEEAFFSMLSELKFLPNSPTLMNAGLPLNQLSACFVLPIDDNLESIFTTLKHMALVQQSGGGTGFNFSGLRPNGSFISESSGASSGPVSFMKLYNAATDSIKQGGKRRGANMGVLHVDHPDIEEFICAKRNEGVLSNFNISVGISDAFMKAVDDDQEWNLAFPAGHIVKTVRAKFLWDLIIENAWHCGDPGLIFLDTINEKNPTPLIGSITCTNPCGEVPLLAHEACNLGSIDVAKFITKKKEVDWKLLQKTIDLSIRFLDNVIEMNNYIIPEIGNVVKGNRKIGLGVMGWANALIKMEIPYASDQALIIARQLMKFIKEQSDRASSELAMERGSFPNWEKSIYGRKMPMRNATRTSIAPTGTISIIADTSSSIEPLFALALHRQNVLNGQMLSEVNAHFLNYLKTHSLYSDNIITDVIKTGSIAQTTLPDFVRQLFQTSLEIAPEWHIKHQAAFQEFTDNAVSKTINFPEDATFRDIGDAFWHAWKLKAKGVTVFRYGSKHEQVLKRGLGDQSRGSCKVCS